MMTSREIFLPLHSPFIVLSTRSSSEGKTESRSLSFINLSTFNFKLFDFKFVLIYDYAVFFYIKFYSTLIKLIRVGVKHPRLRSLCLVYLVIDLRLTVLLSFFSCHRSRTAFCNISNVSQFFKAP